VTQTRIIVACDAGITTADICAFYAANWARPIALSRPDFCHWQMDAAPAAMGRNRSVVALEGDRIIAVMGVTPAPFTFLHQTCDGAELTTWVVAPEARGKGVGKAMLDHLQNRYAVLTGAGITAAALPLYLGAGFTFLAHIPRFFHVADFDKALVFASIPDAARQVTARRQSQARAQLWHARAVQAADLAPAATSLSRFGHFRRDAAHLAWRHDQHPAFRYEAFAVHDPAHAGQGAGVVLREDRVLDTPILHVIDLFGSPRHLPAALAFVEDEARRRGAAFVDISLTAGPLIAHLRARGWSSAIDDPLIELPSLFYPVELRRPPTTSLVLWGRDAPERLYDFGRLHITRADMDLDRPTLAWYEQHPT
jgi:GNAT superfamily N-acetyltransferase